MMQTYEKLRAMKGRGEQVFPSTLAVGDVIRVDGMKWRVQAEPRISGTGSVRIAGYSEDNVHESLFLAPTRTIAKIGVIA